MTEETERLISSLREKTSLIKNELVILKHENQVLREKADKNQLTMDEDRVRYGELKYKYDTLKIAKAFEGNTDNGDLKKQVNAMVREIEKCIELIDQ